jgi:DNA polymerase (family 10)
MPVQNSEIADMFYEAADLLEIEDANPFRVRAYRNAARTIEGHSKRIYKMIDDGENLKEISGIGEDLAEKIREVVDTGNLRFLEDLRSRTPHSLIELLKISGLGPKRVQQLYHKLDIKNLQELQDALKSGKVSELDGFGNKTVDNILEAIEAGSFGEKRTRYDIAEQFVTPILDYLKNLDFVKKAVIAGSFRRRKATIGDLDIIAISDRGEDVCNAFVEYDSVSEILSQGETKASVSLRSGLQVDLRVVKSESFGAALLYFTGSKSHNIHLRNIAVDRGYKLNEYGVYKDDEIISGETEKEIYEFFDMPYIEPELREDRGEIEAGLNRKLPDLVHLEDIRGDLQMHSTESDGKHSIAEMAETADELGYEYIAITDHSSYIGVTNGLKPEDIDSYIRKIDDFNEHHKGVWVLKGIEVDILKDGSLDLPDEVLEKLDIVLASVHSNFDLDEEEQTNRIIKALENPNVNILAHPTTRLIGTRKPIKLDLQKIIEKSLALGCFLEINASPERLDLWDDAIKYAIESGLKLAISTDAHRNNDFYNMKYGVFQARRGWASKSDILNTLSLKELKKQMQRNK